MFSIIKCDQSARIPVEQANGSHAFVQSPGRSLRAVAFEVGRWSSSMLTSLPGAQQSLCYALSLLDASFFIRAGVLNGFRRAMVNRAHGTEAFG